VCEAENLIGRAVKSFNLDVKVPVSWTPWQTWSACSASCGKGTQTRTRFCVQPNGTPAKNEDYDCDGENIEVKICEIIPCPVNGGWSRWGSWTECPGNCVADGEKPVRRRMRRCNNPPPGLGGRQCTGADSQEEVCNLPFCPINGGWTEWSAWSPCSSTCGYDGVTTRTRYCQNPLPQYGGAHCSGSAQESKVCATNKPCPIDGGWSQWSEWSACSKTCGTGVRQRRRRCDSPEPKYEGRACAGDSLEMEKCFERYCKNNDLTKQIRTDRPDWNKYTAHMEYDVEDDSQEQTNNYEYSHGRDVEYVRGPIIPDRAVIRVENSIPITKDTVAINFNSGAGLRRR
jgi:hemicentin